MVMVINLYSTFSIDIFKCAIQASDLWVRSDRHIHVPLAAAISPLAMSPSTLMNDISPENNTTAQHMYMYCCWQKISTLQAVECISRKQMLK